MITYAHCGPLESRRSSRPSPEDSGLLELVEETLVEVAVDPRGTLVFRSTEGFDIRGDVEFLKLKLQELHVRTGLRWWMALSPQGNSVCAGCSRVVVQAPYQEQLEGFARLARAGFDELASGAGPCC